MEYSNTLPLTRLAATLAAAAGVEPPRLAEEKIDGLAETLKEKAGPDGIDRVVIYNPDAIARWLFQKYAGEFAPVLRHAQTAVEFQTVFPPVTPVCFASMYTGTKPAVHGIRKYEKPVVTTDSLFDALIRAGKKTAIVSVRGCSMSKIFLEKDMDYFIMDCDEAVCEKAVELIEKDTYDFLSVYTQDYDSLMHLTGTESEIALNAMRSQIDIFLKIAEAVDASYKKHNTLLGFCTDHGVHNNENGAGKHGEDIPEDRNITHFFGVKARSKFVTFRA